VLGVTASSFAASLFAQRLGIEAAGVLLERRISASLLAGLDLDFSRALRRPLLRFFLVVRKLLNIELLQLCPQT
jgi:hypothetical protein